MTAPRAAWLRAGVLLAWLALAAPAAATTFDFDAGALDAQDAVAAQRLLDAASRQLPERWAAALPPRLAVQWRDDLPAHVSGRSLGHQLRLDRDLLVAWRSESPSLDDPAVRTALATVLHELAHVLDRSPRGGLSGDAHLRELAGWPRRRVLPGNGGNAFTDRSPDIYELHDPREFVAVNLEHYLLDAGYACRRPALAAWFQERLGPPPHPATTCAEELPYLAAQGADGAAQLESLSPSRVYAVDYLFAEGDPGEPMSRWGHSMLRLVICAPQRPLGPDCRLDLRYHRVLSFRAFIGDVQISSWRGLTGGYPSRLFVLPLDQVIDEYTQVELRSLASYPLVLRRQEIASLLERAARVHWNYDGRYRFIGNNCAAETWKLLHDAAPGAAAVQWHGVTPSGLLAALQRAGIADASALADRDAAARAGYYFASAGARYQAMFDVVRAGLPVHVASVEAWLAMAPQARAQWIARGDLRTSAAMLLLEQAAQRRQELRARDFIKRRLLDEGGAQGAQASAQLQEMFQAAGVLARPAALLQGTPGYGIPQADELETARTNAHGRNQRLIEGWPQLRAQARAQLPPPQQRDWTQIEANLDLLGRRVRDLAARM